MRALRHWSFTRVSLTSAVWFVLSVVFLAMFQVRGSFDVSGGGGIGAVSVVFNPLLVPIPVFPPIVLVVAWLIARRRAA